MKKEQTLMIVLLLALWQIGAILVANDILIPYPMEVLKQVIQLFASHTFYVSLSRTVLRVFKGFVISMLIALIPTLLSDYSKKFRNFFSPLQLILKTIPNISYIILAIIWLGAEGSVSCVSFMILFPVFFNSFMNTIDLQQQSLVDVERLYPETFFVKTKTKTIPLLRMQMLYTGKTCASLGLKVGVMAEILGQVRCGIGRQLYLAKMNLDTTSILAWTVVIILLSICFDQIFDYLITCRKKEENLCKSSIKNH